MNFLSSLISLLFPFTCPECGKALKEGDFWCDICLRKNLNIHLINSSFNEYLDGCYALSNYDKGIRRALIQLKYNNQKSRKKSIEYMVESFNYWDRLKKYKLVVPIPLSKQRLEERGYNQVDLIFKDVFKRKNFFYQSNLLIKKRNTKVQSKLRKKDRKENMKNVFIVNKRFNIKDKNILLLDDIYTSGATMLYAAKALKKAGAKSVMGFVVSSGAI